MPRPLSLLLAFLGLRRPRPTTHLGHVFRRLERAASILLICYGFLHFFPQVLFAHSVTTQGITLYSRAPLPPEAISRADRAAALLRSSELALPDRPEHVFICDAPWLFRLFSPTSAGAFAFSVLLTDNVFIADADFPRDTARSTAPVHHTRSLSAVVAHEITHGLIRHRLGWLRGVTLPTWVAEGYCDYVAREGSFPDAEGLRLMATGQNDPSPSFQYFKDRQMVHYLVENQHLSFAQVVARAHDAATVEAETRRAIQSGALL